MPSVLPLRVDRLRKIPPGSPVRSRQSSVVPSAWTQTSFGRVCVVPIERRALRRVLCTLASPLWLTAPSPAPVHLHRSQTKPFIVLRRSVVFGDDGIHEARGRCLDATPLHPLIPPQSPALPCPMRPHVPCPSPRVPTARVPLALRVRLPFSWPRALGRVHRHFPKTTGRVVFCDISTPLTIEYYLRTGGGGAIGLDVTPERFVDAEEVAALDIDFVGVKGLWFAGQDALMCGQVNAAATGLLCALRMLGPLHWPFFAARAVRLLLPPLIERWCKKGSAGM